MQKLLRSDFHHHNFSFRLIFTFLFLLAGGLIYGQYLRPAGESLPLSVRSQGMFILKVDDMGRLYDRQSTSKEYEQYLSKTVTKQNFTIVHSLNKPESVRGLKILLRATDQLLANPEALMSFRRAAARWERVITTPVTAVIDVDYGTTRWGTPWGDGVLGSTQSALEIIRVNNRDGNVADVVTALKNNHAGDPQLQNLYNAIPIPTPTTAGTNLNVAIGGQIVLQVLGFLPAETDPDPEVNPFGYIPSIGFNSNFAFDLDPSDGVDGGMEDFDATVVHEIGHALGFVSIIGNGGDPDNYFAPWDLFRVRPEAVEPGSLTGFGTAQRIVTPGPPPSDVLATEGGLTYYKANHVFFDGINELELSTATGAREGGDGQQASHWRDNSQRLPSLGTERTIGIMDPTSEGTGIRSIMNNHDLRGLEVIGYNINYSPKFASISAAYDGKTLDLNKSLDTVKAGDINLNSSKVFNINLTNLSLDNALDYEVEIIIDRKLPSSLTATLTANSAEGSILSGQSANVPFTITTGQTAGVVYGTLRFHTNDEDRLVVDIPFEFSAGGAIAPTVQLSTDNLGDFRFSNESGKDTLTRSFAVINKGNMDLNYRLLTSLSAKSNNPDSTTLALLPKAGASNDRKVNNLSKFFNRKAVNNSTILFSTDFESDFGGFTASGAKAEDWNRITKGAASLDGHSKPTAAYFGKDFGDSLQTRPHSNATLISPKIDLSSVPPQDLVTFSFNYYLQAEEGYDFAYVLVSVDNGNTFEEIAASNNGILVNTTSWQSVVIQLPFLSGNPEPVQFAFKFTSDTLVNEEGWYIDDIQVAAMEGNNSIYTTPRAGVLSGLNSSQKVDLSVNAGLLEPGFYSGGVSVVSNDPVNPSYNLPFKVSNILITKIQPNIMYGSTGRGAGAKGKLLAIDLNTGNGTEIGSSGFEPLKSITINPSTQEITALNTSAFIPSSLVLVDVKTGYGLFQSLAEVKLSAIVYDLDNSLFAAGDDKKLYKADLETGKVTLVGNLAFKAAALAINPENGEMWASVDETADKDRIYKINKTDGSSTLVGQTGLGKIVRGLAFGGKNNILYGTVGEDTQFSTLLSMNQESAAATEIGPVNFRGVMGLAMKVDTTVAVEEDENIKIPSKFELSQNYPNPFNPATVINYQVPENGFVTLKVYNVLGQEVVTLVNKEQSAGKYSIQFNAEKLSTGIYFYELRVNSHVSVKKMMLTK